MGVCCSASCLMPLSLHSNYPKAATVTFWEGKKCSKKCSNPNLCCSDGLLTCFVQFVYGCHRHTFTFKLFDDQGEKDHNIWILKPLQSLGSYSSMAFVNVCLFIAMELLDFKHILSSSLSDTQDPPEVRPCEGRHPSCSSGSNDEVTCNNNHIMGVVPMWITV